MDPTTLEILKLLLTNSSVNVVDVDGTVQLAASYASKVDSTDSTTDTSTTDDTTGDTSTTDSGSTTDDTTGDTSTTDDSTTDSTTDDTSGKYGPVKVSGGSELLLAYTTNSSWAAPEGYTLVVSDSWDNAVSTIDSATEDYVELYLDGNSSFNSSSTQRLNRPNVMIQGNGATVNCDASAIRLSSRYNAADNIGIKNLNFVGNGSGSDGIWGENRVTGLLLENVSLTGFSDGLMFSSGKNDYYGTDSNERIYIKNVKSVGNSYYGAYLHGYDMHLVDCEFQGNGSTSHACRITYMEQGAITGCVFGNSGDNRHNLKLHGPGDDATGSMSGRHTQDVLIENNDFYAHETDWSCAIAPQSGSKPEYNENIYRMTIKGNRFWLGSRTQVHLYLSLHDSVIGPNTYELPDDGSVDAYRIEQRGYEDPPSGNTINETV